MASVSSVILKAIITFLPCFFSPFANNRHHGRHSRGKWRTIGIGANLVVLDKIDTCRTKLIDKPRDIIRPHSNIGFDDRPENWSIGNPNAFLRSVDAHLGK